MKVERVFVCVLVAIFVVLVWFVAGCTAPSYVELLPTKPETPGMDYWQHPLLTMCIGGDCEDKAILLWWLWSLKGVRSEVVFGDIGLAGHAWVERDGVLYDPMFHLTLPPTSDPDSLRLCYRRDDHSPFLLMRVLDFERRTGITGFNDAYCPLTRIIRNSSLPF